MKPKIFCLTATLMTASASAQFGPRVVMGDLNTIGAYDLATLDAEPDGDLDVVATSNGAVVYLAQSRPGVYDNFRVLSSGHADIRAIQTADMDADGDRDVIFATRFGNGGEVLWLQNLGFGQFSMAMPVGPLAGALDIEIADMDNDSDLDVVAVGFDSREVVWFEQTSVGTFAPPQTIESGNGTPFCLTVADFDGNGALDVVVGTNAPSQLLLFRAQRFG
ncbi:MAG: VCBS repeat-containing protein [Planctomycetota bacterium]